MNPQEIGRRGVLKRGVGLGLAVSAAGFASAGAQGAATPSAGGETDIDRLKEHVRSEYDRVGQDLEALGDQVSDDGREAYDRIKSGFDALGRELERAENIPHDSVREVKRAYRDVQHGLEDLDHEAEVALHKTDDAGQDVWHDARKGLHDVHKAIDHVIDAV